jgi:xanthine dehydrogenase accessory factor
MRGGTLQALIEAETKGFGLVRAVRLSDGREEMVAAGDTDGPLAQAAHSALREDRSHIADVAGEEWFLQVLNPPVHLIVAGAVHIAQSLARMAADLGWRVTIVDPRTGWANEARFPGVTIAAAWPDEAMAALGLNRRTAVVTLTHDPKLDDPALTSALRSEAFYIGALGSKKTHAARRERLSVQGFNDADVARIHGPVGLDIGASSPAEIAVSILAQIVERLRRAS